MMDVAIAAGADVCTTLDPWGDIDLGVVSPVPARDGSLALSSDFAIGRATGDRIRLYLFGVPRASSMRNLAIAITAPESRFERAAEAAAPVVESIEFHAP